MTERTKTLVKTLLATGLLAVSLNAAAVKPSERTTVVDVAVAANEELNVFNTLLFALGAEGQLIGTLDGNGQFTVFAPLDSAFTNLEDNVLPLFCYSSVLELATDQPGYISDVLHYHVARGNRDSSEVLPADRIRMLSGDFVTRTPGSLELTDELGFTAHLVLPYIDIPADNGVIHVIDRVLLPYAPASNCT